MITNNTHFAVATDATTRNAYDRLPQMPQHAIRACCGSIENHSYLQCTTRKRLRVEPTIGGAVESRMKERKGRYPKGIQPVATLRDDDGKTWLLFRLAGRDSSNGWHGYKLCVVGRALRKGNYSLGWSPDQLRPADSHDSQALTVDRPELLAGLMAYIEFIAP